MHRKRDICNRALNISLPHVQCVVLNNWNNSLKSDFSCLDITSLCDIRARVGS